MCLLEAKCLCPICILRGFTEQGWNRYTCSLLTGMSQWTAAGWERVGVKWNPAEPKLPLGLFNPHVPLGNNMPPANRPILSVKPREHHLAAVAVQVGKKRAWIRSSWHLMPSLRTHKLLAQMHFYLRNYVRFSRSPNSLLKLVGICLFWEIS